MTDIKRWNVESDEQDGPCSLWNIDTPDGDFVKYAEHAAFVSALQEQVLKLAVENDRMKTAIKTIFPLGVDDENGKVGFTDAAKECYESSVKTPATDAVIREIGAKAVDKLLKDYSAHAVTAGLSTDDLVTVSEAIQALEHCANQLRAGDVS